MIRCLYSDKCHSDDIACENLKRSITHRLTITSKVLKSTFRAHSENNHLTNTEWMPCFSSRMLETIKKTFMKFIVWMWLWLSLVRSLQIFQIVSKDVVHDCQKHEDIYQIDCVDVKQTLAPWSDLCFPNWFQRSCQIYFFLKSIVWMWNRLWLHGLLWRQLFTNPSLNQVQANHHHKSIFLIFSLF